MTTNFKTLVEQEVVRLEAEYPTPEEIPGCMKLLDNFLSCNALRSQMKSLYRYGGMAVCGDKMEDFKFCMSLKAMEADDKRNAWIRRRAEWWAARRLSKSSEEVWDIRTEPIVDFPPSYIPDGSSMTSTIE